MTGTWIKGTFRGLAVAGFFVVGVAWAGLPSEADANKALKEALSRGAGKAVELLGKSGGFSGNERVRIPLPEQLKKAETLLRGVGAGQLADQLVDTMNRAAEQAVVEARPVLLQSIKSMTLKDGIEILKGPEDAATQYFRRSTGATLNAKFRPIVEKATRKVELARHYERFAGKAAKLGLLDARDADLNGYVTQKTTDGLFLMLADEEKQIRKDPLASGSKIIKKVFGGLLN